MKNLDEFNKINDEFTKKILEQNSTITKTPIIENTDKLSDSYINATQRIKEISEQYQNFYNIKSYTGDTFIQLLCYLIYFELLKHRIDEYHDMTKIINILFSENSKINILLKKLEKYVVIYKSLASTTEEKEQAKENIILILKELYDALIDAFTDLQSWIPDISKNVQENIKVNEDGEVEITNEVFRNVILNQIPDGRFIAYSGFFDRAGFIAQKSLIYMKRPYSMTEGNTFEKYIRITSPGVNLYDIKFEHEPKNIICNIFNIYDYVATFLSEKDQINEEEKDEEENKNIFDIITRTIRFGGLLSSQDIDDNAKKQAIALRFAPFNNIKGTVNKLDTYKITNFSMEAIFDNKEKIDSIADKFGDKVKIIHSILNEKNNKTYTMEGQLTFDQELTNKKNNEIAELIESINNESTEDRTDDEIEILNKFKNTKKGSYYIGELNLYDENHKMVSSDNTSIAAQFTSKKVILKIEYASSDEKNAPKINIICELDNNQGNNTIMEESDSMNEYTVVSHFLSNFHYEQVPVSNKFISDTPDEEILSNLLGLTQLDPDSENFDFQYSTLLNNFLKAKNNLINLLILKIKEINNLVTSIITISTIIPQIDANYKKEYTEKLIINFTEITNNIMPYTVYEETNLEDIYNGTVYNKLLSSVDKIEKEFIDLFNEIIEVDNIYYDYDKKFELFNNKEALINPDLTSSILAIQNILTLNESSINVLSMNGYEFIKLNILSYDKWIEYYNATPNGEYRSNRYFIDDYTKSILYMISQILPILDAQTEEYKLISKYIKILLFRLLLENTNNPEYNGIFDSTLFELAKEYKKLWNKYTINLNNINADYINPYIIDLYPRVADLNLYDLKLLKEYDLNYICKPLIYESILEDGKTESINNKFKSIFIFLTNCRTLNFRELIFLISLLDVYTEIKSNKNIIGINSLDEIVNINSIINDYKKIFNILLKFYNTLNANDKFIDFLNKTNTNETKANKITKHISYYEKSTTDNKENLIPKNDDQHQNKVEYEYNVTLFDLINGHLVEKEEFIKIIY